MRTTLTLEDSISAELNRLAHDNRQSFKVVVNEVLRVGLEAKKIQKTPIFRETPSNLGMYREYEGKLNQVLDELLIEDYLEKEKRSR